MTQVYFEGIVIEWLFQSFLSLAILPPDTDIFRIRCVARDGAGMWYEETQ